MSKYQFGPAIRALRLRRKIGLRQFASTIDQYPSNWSNIETGKLPPPRDDNRISQIVDMLATPEDADHLKNLARLDYGLLPEDVLHNRHLKPHLSQVLKRLGEFSAQDMQIFIDKFLADDF